MKKALCIILSMMILLVTFAACGDKEDENFEYVTNANGEVVTNEDGVKQTQPVTTTDADGTDASTAGSSKADGTTNPTSGSNGTIPTVPDLENFNPNASKEDLLDEGTKVQKTTLRDDIIAKTIKDKKFTMTMTVLGQGTEIPTTVTMDGDKFGATLNLNGIDSKVINKDGKTYVAFNFSGMKMYLETESESIGMEDIMTPQAGDDQKYVKTTTVKDNGKTYTCEEYKTDDGIVTKFYFEGKKWVRQETIDGDTISICEIKDFKNTVDNSVFDLKGYTKLDEKALAAMGGGM